MLTPGRAVACIIDFEHGEMGHEAVRGGTMPVFLTWCKEHAVARTNNRNRAAALLTQADTFSHHDRLPLGVGVPRRSRTGREVNTACLQTRTSYGRCNRINVHDPREP